MPKIFANLMPSIKHIHRQAKRIAMRFNNDFDIRRITTAEGNCNRNGLLFLGGEYEFVSLFAIC
jgi:hypothetical protein